MHLGRKREIIILVCRDPRLGQIGKRMWRIIHVEDKQSTPTFPGDIRHEQRLCIIWSCCYTINVCVFQNLLFYLDMLDQLDFLFLSTSSTYLNSARVHFCTKKKTHKIYDIFLKYYDKYVIDSNIPINKFVLMVFNRIFDYIYT